MPKERAVKPDPHGKANKGGNREGYRGWIIIASAIDNLMIINQSHFAKGKLSHLPKRLVWPILGDYDGAKAFVDAVMISDLKAMTVMQGAHPDYDLGLGEFYTKLQEAAKEESNYQIKTLRCKPLTIGRTLRLEVVTDKRTGQRKLQESIYRGNIRIACKVHASEAISTKADQLQEARN